jgi:hypothetical protein
VVERNRVVHDVHDRFGSTHKVLDAGPLKLATLASIVLLDQLAMFRS